MQESLEGGRMRDGSKGTRETWSFRRPSTALPSSPETKEQSKTTYSGAGSDRSGGVREIPSSSSSGEGEVARCGLATLEMVRVLG
jgi:hypothetical protein